MNNKVERLTHLEHLRQQTKSDPAMMVDLINIYLEQTPTLVAAMRNGLASCNWQKLKAAAHKIIPSFRVLGIHNDYADIARNIEELATGQQSLDTIGELVAELDQVCDQIYIELHQAVELLKKSG